MVIASIDLDPRLPDNRSRPIDIGFDLSGKFRRRTADRSKPKDRKAFLRLRPGNELRHAPCEQINDRRRRSGRRYEADRQLRLLARKTALCHGWDFRNDGRSLEAGDG